MAEVESDGVDYEYCGSLNNPCLTLVYAVNVHTSLTEIKLVYSSSTPHGAENETVTLKYLPSYVIEGEDATKQVEKAVTEINDTLFTLLHCDNIIFSSLAFLLPPSSLSHSVFFTSFSSLILSSISIAPSDSTSTTQLDNSLITVNRSSLYVYNSSFQSVRLSKGNGSVIYAGIGQDFSFVIEESSLLNCSAEYGGAIYLILSTDPSRIEMKTLTFAEEGSRNEASVEGNTLYIVWNWKSVLNIPEDLFSSFVPFSESANEVKVEMSNTRTVTLEELLGSGSGIGECTGGEVTGFVVCTQIEIYSEENVGKVIVSVKDEGGEEEEGSEYGCNVEMESGDIKTEMGRGEVNGEEVVMDMGSELTKVFHKCEDVSIVMNLSYPLFNG